MRQLSNIAPGFQQYFSIIGRGWEKYCDLSVALINYLPMLKAEGNNRVVRATDESRCFLLSV